MLEFDRKRAFRFRYVYLCPLILVVAGFVTGYDAIAAVSDKTDMLPAGFSIEYAIRILSGQSIQFLLPVFSALPFSAGFVEDWQSGMIKNVAGRTNRHDYLCSKALTTAVSGGIVFVIAAIMFLGVSLLLFLRLELPEAGLQAYREPVHIYIRLVCRLFCMGALWGEIGLLVSTALNHPFMAWLSPFMVCYLLIIFCERYFTWCHVFYPREWFLPEQAWPLGEWGICLWLLFLTVITGIAFYRMGLRRLSNV